MATEYIKRKNVIETICNLCRIENDDCSYPRCTIINTVKNIHAADVVERKNGEWIAVDPAYEYYKCSECRKCTTFDMKPYNFCPNCGADMRGDSDV